MGNHERKTDDPVPSNQILRFQRRPDWTSEKEYVCVYPYTGSPLQNFRLQDRGYRRVHPGRGVTADTSQARTEEPFSFLI